METAVVLPRAAPLGLLGGCGRVTQGCKARKARKARFGFSLGCFTQVQGAAGSCPLSPESFASFVFHPNTHSANDLGERGLQTGHSYQAKVPLRGEGPRACGPFNRHRPSAQKQAPCGSPLLAQMALSRHGNWSMVEHEFARPPDRQPDELG